MTVAIAPALGFGAQRFLNNLQGITPNVNGLINTYAAGTSTPQATFTDSTGATPNPNPIVLDANGRVPNEIWFTAGQVYKLVETDQFGTVIGTWDNVPATASAADIANLQAQITAFATSFTTGALTVTGATTLNALSVGAITGTGSVNIGTNTITSGAITSTGASSLGSLTLTSGNLALGGNSITGGLNATFTGTVTAASFTTTALNAASFLTGGVTNSGNIVNFNTSGTLSGSGITNTAGTITFAAAGTYDVLFSGLFSQPSASINISTTIYFGGTANTIVGPVAANGQQMSITGANGDVGAPYSMRAIVITNAINQTLTVNSTLAFSANYQVTAGAYITISQR
jgi:hypothetical protein